MENGGEGTGVNPWRIGRGQIPIRKMVVAWTMVVEERSVDPGYTLGVPFSTILGDVSMVG